MDVNSQNTSVPNEPTIPQESLTPQKDSDKKTLTNENPASNEMTMVVDETTLQPTNNNLLSQKPENGSLVIPNKNSVNKVMYAGIIFMAASILLALALYLR